MKARARAGRRVALVVAGALLFAVGVAVGEALNDAAPPAGTQTRVRTLTPQPLPPARETVTVTTQP